MNLEWIVSSCILILVVLAVRAALGNKISAGLRYALWGIVLIRLLLPVQLFTSPVAGISVDPSISEKLQEHSIYILPVHSAPAEDSLVTFREDGTAVDPDSFGYPRLENNGKTVVRYAEKLSAVDVLKLLWLIACIAILLVILFSNFRFSTKLRRVRKPLEGADCKIPVYTANGLPSPCLFGVFRPAVYVAAETAENPAMLRHILAHELTHYKHLDHIWSVLRSLALALHWWNPLVWLAVVRSRQDGELACDAGALKMLGREERVLYGETLLALVTAEPTPKDLLNCATTMSGEKRSLRERIRRISCEPKQLVGSVVAVVAIISVTAVCAFGRAADAPDRYSVQPLTLSRQPDLNRDGVPETIQLLKNDSDTPEWRLEVNQGEDPEFGIWSVTLDETHGNCGTYFLYQEDGEDGEDYLLSYTPKMQQGYCTYTFEMFHFEDIDETSDRPDNRYIDVLRTVTFDINFDAPDHEFNPAKIDTFMEEVNRYIGKSTLLVNTNHWMTYLEEDADGRLYDNILAYLKHPGSDKRQYTTLFEALKIYADYAEDHPDDTNSALGDFLADLQISDIGNISGQNAATASELVTLLREAAPNRKSRFYDYFSHYGQQSWIWSEACWTVPLADGNILYLDASYKDREGIAILLEMPDESASAAFYSSAELHELICQAGEPYPAELLPYAPDLDHDGKPEQLYIMPMPDGMTWDLYCRSEDGWTWFDTASTPHPGWNALFLYRKDGEDYLLRYHPYMSQGGAGYNYEVFYLQEGRPQVIQENAVSFNINPYFFLNGERFEPKEIADFMDEVNALLADSVQLLNTDGDLLETFEREGRLYDSMFWLDTDEYGQDLSLLEKLLIYRNKAIADSSVPDMRAVLADITEDDLQNVSEHRTEITETLHRVSEKLNWENNVTGESNSIQIISCIPLSIRQENPNNSQMDIYLEATYIENYVCVTCEGWNTVLFYSENPNNDATYLSEAPFEVTYYFEDAELYQSVCEWGTDAAEMDRYNNIQEMLDDALKNPAFIFPFFS